MKRIISVLFLALGLAITAHAQQEEVYSSTGKPIKLNKKEEKKKGFDPQRIVFGGGFGLGFGDVTNVAVSPVVGYAITDKFIAGVGVGYQYVRVKDYWSVFDPNTADVLYKPFTSNVFSPSIWTRYVVWKNLFVHAEYEHNFMSYTRYYNNTSVWPAEIVKDKVKYNAPSLLLGAGIRMPVSDRVSFIIMGLYDVIQDQYSPYRGTVAFRFGVNAGF